jgi:hypothetical protein
MQRLVAKQKGRVKTHDRERVLLANALTIIARVAVLRSEPEIRRTGSRQARIVRF